MTPTEDPGWPERLDTALAAHDGPVAPYAQLATVGPDGRPANRTVVVRGRADRFRLLVTTDARSAKAGQLAANPWAELCWWFPTTREQFRLRARVTAVGPEADGDDQATRRRVWTELPEASRQSFTWPEPGAPRAEPAAFAALVPADPPGCFTLLVLDPDRVEHLDLRDPPHRRTRFTTTGGGAWVAVRLNP